MTIEQVPQSDTFDQWRIRTNVISNNVGNLDLLSTTTKTNLVASISEVNDFINAQIPIFEANISLLNSLIGNLLLLTTTEKTNLVGAINELDLATLQKVTDNGATTTTPSTFSGGITVSTVDISGTINTPTGKGIQGQVLTSQGNLSSPTWEDVRQQASDLPIGSIIIWSGPISGIPVNWQICDGTNSTPDLRNKFVIGAVQDSAGVAQTNITGAGSVTGGNKDAVVVSHTHGYIDYGHQHYTGWGENWAGPYGDDGNPSHTGGYRSDGDNRDYKTSGPIGGISISITASGESATNKNLPPYYALAYMMKVSSGNGITGDNGLSINGPVYTNGSAGKAGQVLTSRGPGLSPYWAFSAGGGNGGGGFAPIGTIVLWCGAIADIPTDWSLCNGSGGTPDLRNKFVIGADADSGGISQTSILGTVSKTGGNKDSIIPYHTHTYADPGHIHNVVNNPAGTNYSLGIYSGAGIGGGFRGGDNGWTKWATNIQTSTTGITINATGVSAANANLPPYTALAYIMKTTETTIPDQVTVSGTPATNNIAKFSAAAEITGSIIYDNGTSVGIGITNAANIATGYTTLDIRGSSGGGVKLGTTGTAYGYMSGSINGIDIGTTTNKSFTIFTNNQAKVTVNPSGAVGFNGANYGTAGQALLSHGDTSSPTWSDLPVIGSTNQSWNLYVDAGTLTGVGRARNIVYTNLTGSPIMVNVTGGEADITTLYASPDGVTFTVIAYSNVTNSCRPNVSGIIPPGWKYKVTSTDGIYYWSELS